MTEALVVVASDRHVERLAAAGVRCTTRRALVERLERLVLPGVAFADAMETRVALAAVVQGDEAFRNVTVSSLDGAIGVLRDACVEAAALERVAASRGPSADRARLLNVALTRLDRKLADAGLTDARCSRAMLAAKLGGGRDYDLFAVTRAKHVVATWIVDWSAADALLWRALDAALSRVGGSARVELPTFASRLDAEREVDPLELVWDDLAKRLAEPPKQRTIRAALGDLTFSSAPSDETSKSTEVRLGNDAHAEAAAALDAIMSAIARATPVDRIAVAALTKDDPALVRLRRALEEAGVAVYEARGRVGQRASILGFVSDAMGAAAHGLERGRVAALARSRYLSARKLTGIDDPRRARAALDALALALETTPTVTSSDPVATLEATARAGGAGGELARKLGELLASVERPGTRSEHVAHATAMLAGLGVSPEAELSLAKDLAGDGPRDAVAKHDLQAFYDDARAWRALTSALVACGRAASRVRAAGPCAWTTFRHELASALEHELARGDGARAGAVRFVGTTELAEEELSLLVVVGATVDALPAKRDGGGLITVGLARSLAEVDPLAAPASAALSSARSLASLAWAAARAERVVLTTRSRDDTGALIAPSPLVSWLSRWNVHVRRAAAGVVQERPWTPRDRTLALLALAPERADSIATDAQRRAHVEALREAFHQGGEVSDAAIVGKLDKSDALRAVLETETGGGARALTVTSLEAFARCAFQGYSRVVLGGKGEQLREDAPDRSEQGLLVHDLLRVAFEATRDAWATRPRDRDAIMREAMAAVDATIDETQSGLRRASNRQLREEVAGVVASAARDLAWDFLLAEQAFGGTETGPAWHALDLSDHDESMRLVLAGRIDRVDRAHATSALRVVDYKRRSAQLPARGLGETLLQLPLYARVAVRELGGAEASGLYVLTGAPDDAPKKSWHDRWAALEVLAPLTPVTAHARDVVRSVRQGVLLPLPREPSACGKCDHEGVCRRPRFAIVRTEDA